MNPHEELERELAAAKLAQDQARARQALRRAEAEERLRIAMRDVGTLDRELAPLSREVEELQIELSNRRKRTVGPWVVSRKLRWPEARLYLHGPSREWFRSRVWLRVVTRATHQWEAQLWDVDVAPDLVLGPPSEDPEADLAAHKKTVEARVRELGWYVIEGEEPSAK